MARGRGGGSLDEGDGDNFRGTQDRGQVRFYDWLDVGEEGARGEKAVRDAAQISRLDSRVEICFP